MIVLIPASAKTLLAEMRKAKGVNLGVMAGHRH
jgi:hypothetical protein